MTVSGRRPGGVRPAPRTLLFNFPLFVDSQALSPKDDVKVTVVVDMPIEPDYSTARS